MEENWFKDWFDTEYYHQLYKERDEAEAAKFINKLIEKLNPSPESYMLDIACGKGRHALQLANKGFDVTGIDLSASSIKEALHFSQSNLHFFEHDMRLPFWINYFDYAFNFFTSFGYFKTRREDNNAIRNMAQSLKHNGTLVMDYLNVEYTENNMIHLDKKVIDQVDYTITKWYDDRFFYKKILIEDNRLQKNHSFTENVAKYTLQDFKSIFEANKLKIVDFYGDYQFGKYDQQFSPRLIMFVRKS